MILAREAGMMRPLALGVILAHELLDVPLPEVIRTYALQDQMVSYLAKVAYRSMLCPQPETPPLSLSLLFYIYRLRCANSFTERLNNLQNILSCEDWKTARFPDSLYFLYYLLRLPLYLQQRLFGGGTQMDRYKTRRNNG
jgi:hypothetical protein